MSSILNFRRRVEDLENAPGSRKALLHGIRDGRDVCHLPIELLQQAGKYHQAGPQRHSPLHVKPAAIGKQNHQAQLRK